LIEVPDSERFLCFLLVGVFQQLILLSARQLPGHLTNAISVEEKTLPWRLTAWKIHSARLRQKSGQWTGRGGCTQFFCQPDFAGFASYINILIEGRSLY
jgi:hypothetical protein